MSNWTSFFQNRVEPPDKPIGSTTKQKSKLRLRLRDSIFCFLFFVSIKNKIEGKCILHKCFNSQIVEGEAASLQF